ncbi:MAG: hypothetical protein KDD36_11255 [Flavobacteriales bacterium]|nr:hypothetical protein [Flavobacteriales bacterium]
MSQSFNDPLAWLDALVRSRSDRDQNERSLEEVNFNALHFCAFVFSLVSGIFNFIESFPWSLRVFSVVSTAVLIVLYFFSRFRRKYNLWVSLFVILVVLTVYWLINGGHHRLLCVLKQIRTKGDLI